MQLLVNEVSPVKSSLPGELVTLETSTFVLHSLTLPTKVQMFVTANLRTERLAEFLVRQGLYEHERRCLRTLK